MWAVVCRVLAGVGLVVSAVALVGFAVAAIGVWHVKTEANRRTTELAARAHTAVGAADHAVGFVRGVIDQADKELENARKNPAAEPPREPINPFVQLTARQASENLAGSVERANAAVVTASDAVLVADAALKLFDNDEQLKTWFGVKPEHLVRTKTDLDVATRELKTVRTILGIPVAVGTHPTAEQLVTVESALKQARVFTDQMGAAVETARARVDETKRAVDEWVLRAAIAVTLVGVLGAAGQFFMARFCWRVLRRQPA